MAEFLNMGGYAVYVWPAYAITAIVLMLNWWSARRYRADQWRAARRRAADRNEAAP
jgi:heme exporter protein CcmD